MGATGGLSAGAGATCDRTVLYHGPMPRVWPLAAVLFAALSSCSAPTAPTEFTLSAGRYADAFAAAKDVLREYEFELDRVDAIAGVITTAPRASSGLATPWIPHASDLSGAFRGVAQFEQRIAQVEFDRSARPVVGAESEILTCRVAVAVERFHKPGRRVDATSVRLRSFARGTEDDRPVGGCPFAVGRGDDAGLASRLVRAMRTRLEGPSAAD